MMTVRELIEALEDYDQDAEVRIAIQPRWPLEYSISDVVCSDSIKPDPVDEQPTEQHPDADPQGFLPDEDKPVVVYLTEGSQIGYAPAGVFGGR
jgi:hypothetical protein